MRIDDAQGAFRRLGVHWALLAGHTNATKVTLARVEGSWLWQRRRGTQRFRSVPASLRARKPKTGDLLRTDDFYETVLAMASHDLRQPLQLIISAQELLARRL